MIRALEIDDILYAITAHVAQLPPGAAIFTLRSLACTNRAWSQHALNQIWFELTPTMLPHLASTMSEEHWCMKNDPYFPKCQVVTFRNENVAPSQWLTDRFLFYSRRIQVINFEITIRALLFDVADSVLGKWARYSAGKAPLFPNLRKFLCSLDNPAHEPALFVSGSFSFAQSIIATSPALHSLSLSAPIANKTVEEAISRLCGGDLPRVTTLELHYRTDESSLLGELLQRFTNLQKLVSDYPIPSPNLEYLASLTQLKELRMKVILNSPPLCPGFSALRILSLPLLNVAALQTSIDALHGVHLDTIDCTLGSELTDVEIISILTSIKNQFRFLSELHLRSWPHPGPSIIIADLTHFAAYLPANLCSFTLSACLLADDPVSQVGVSEEDVAAFIEACPSTLRALKLDDSTPALRAEASVLLARQFHKGLRPPTPIKIDQSGSALLLDAARKGNVISQSFVNLSLAGNIDDNMEVFTVARAILQLFPMLRVVKIVEMRAKNDRLVQLVDEIHNICRARSGMSSVAPIAARVLRDAFKHMPPSMRPPRLQDE